MSNSVSAPTAGIGREGCYRNTMAHGPWAPLLGLGMHLAADTKLLDLAAGGEGEDGGSMVQIKAIDWMS